MTEHTAADDLAFAEFPPPSREQWLALVSGALKGASFDKRLVSKTYDGISIAPLYGRDAAARAVAGRAAATPWEIAQRIELPDPAAANAQALHDLEGGATGLALVFSGAIGARGFGLDAGALAPVLDGVFLDAAVALDLDCAENAAAIAHTVTDVVRQRGVAPQSTAIRFGFDPLGKAATGATAAAPPWPQFAAAIVALAGAGYRGPFVVADGRVIHDAGGSEAQELAYVLAAALAYLRALEFAVCRSPTPGA